MFVSPYKFVFVLFAIFLCPLMSYAEELNLSSIQKLLNYVQKTTEETRLRDPFQYQNNRSAPPSGQASSVKPSAPKSFWQLQGVFRSANGDKALLNNRFVSVGDVIEGWQVTAIGESSVTLSKGSKSRIIRLE